MSELLPVSTQAPLGNEVTSAPSSNISTAEGLARAAPLEPVDTNDDRPGASSQAVESPQVELDDANAEADGELVDPAGGADPDAGAPAPPSTPGEPCSTLAFAGSCYQVFAEFVSWDVAEQRCVDWGGHLASVESSEEDGFLDDWPSTLGIAGQDGSGIWLGGTDAPGDGEFRWWDDSPLTFDNWGPNQPDNGAGVDCIEKRNDGSASWYDRRCTDAQRYACERPL